MSNSNRSTRSAVRRWLTYGSAFIAVCGLIALALATFLPAQSVTGTTSLVPRSLAAPGGPGGKSAAAIPEAKPYGVEVVSAEAFGTIASLAAVPDVPRSPRPADDDAAVLPKYQQNGPASFQIDSMLQIKPGALDSLGSPIANFEGMGITEAGGYLPPDTQGDIGYDSSTGKRYYFQWVNVTYKVWDVTNPAAPTVVIPTTQGNALWAAALPGSECALRNHGDPISLFDEQAGRWMISQFALGASFSGPFHQCIAVSQTADPAGGWYVYDFPYRNATTYLNDYPHFGVWPDATYNAYYMTVHQFNASGTAWLGQAAAAYDRAKILVGDPGAQAVYFDLYSVNQNFGGMLPADLDGTPPPAGTPGLFFEVDDDTAGLGADAMRVWELRPNWTTPASSTFGISGQPNYTVTVASFNLLPCTTAGSRNCIPQSGTSQRLDAIGDRLMYRAAFRTVGSTQSVVINHTVWADGTDRAGVRWYEARRNPADGSWVIHQQGTYAPTDGQYRWMGSVAMDASGDIALGYSASSSTALSTIRYAGRMASDPVNTLPQTEITMATSTGSQTHSQARWGDYSMMGVDPVDGCTFWYTQEYHGATSSSAWQTRIGSFKFPECGGTDFYLTAAPVSQEVCLTTNALYTVDVGSTGSYSAPVTLSTANNPGAASFVPNPVTPPANGSITSTLTIAGATAGNYTFGITGTDALTSHVTSVQLNVVGDVPTSPTLVSPADGATDVSPKPTLTWTAIPNVTDYYLEVASDVAFTNVVYTATVAGTSHLVGSNLPSNAQLYWRVRAANVCGAGTFATPFGFTTANIVYATYCATPNLAIPDNNAAGVTSTLVVAPVGTLLDLNLIISGTHTFVGDLIITATNGLSNVTLLNRPTTGSGACSGNDLPNLTLDDDPGGTPGTSFQSACVSGSNPAQAYTANGSYTPLAALSALDGQPLNGTWNLRIADRAAVDTGTLQQWCLVTTVAGSSGSDPAPSLAFAKTVGTDPTTCAAGDTLSVGYGNNVTYCYKVTNTGNVSLTTHSLVDDHLGTLLNNFSYTLPPLVSTFVTRTVALTATTVNSAIWTADYLTYTVAASDMATVTVVTTPTIALSQNSLVYTQTVDTNVIHTLIISNTGIGSNLTWNFVEAPGYVPTRGNVSSDAPSSPAETDRAHDTRATAPVAARNSGTPVPLLPISSLAEGFDNIGTLAAAGWYTQNNSSPLGITGWFQGSAATFPAQAGATNAYIGANFNNTTGANTISNWLLTPELNLSNGATFTFYTRKVSPDTYPDRLQVRLSTNGASTNVGTLNTSVGDFTNLMLDINPTLVTGVYPIAWQQYTVTVSGLGAPTTGRIAFRYFVTNGGPSGANSDYIGIDTVAYASPVVGCDTPTDIPWLTVSPLSGSTPGGSASNVSVGFNTTGLTDGNTYTATLCLNNNSSNARLQLPVTLTVGIDPTAITLKDFSTASPSNSVVWWLAGMIALASLGLFILKRRQA